jgi:predicted metal-dependent peptidase
MAMPTPAETARARASIKKAQTRLVRHPETRWLSQVLMLGTVEVIEDAAKCPTAYTDGINTRYGVSFTNSLPSVQQVTGLVLHEELHKALRHMPRLKALREKDAQMANKVADYVVNDFIVHITDKTLCVLPNGGLYDPMFHGWTEIEIFRYLNKEKQPRGGGGKPSPANGKGAPAPGNSKLRGDDSLDEHDASGADAMTKEQEAEQGRQIQEALTQGALMAGVMGQDLPQVIKASTDAKIDWVSVLADFVTNSIKGGDEYTYARLNRQYSVMGYVYPGTESETLGSGLVSIDASGSTIGPVLDKFVGEFAALVRSLVPDEVRVLWWDTEVRSEQRFDPSSYDTVTEMLKCVGGGGTMVSCVDKYMRKHGINPEFHIIFTDGYVEDYITWQGDRSIPTLWIVTENKRFVPPFGQMVFAE